MKAFLLFFVLASLTFAQNQVLVDGTTVGAPSAVLIKSTATPGNCVLDDIATPYSSNQFYVDTDGNYDFSVTDPIDAGFGDDTIVLLYEISFDPSNPCTNWLVRYDNYSSGGSGFTHALTSARQYIIVGNGLFADSYDAYQFQITGPGGSNITQGVLPVELTLFNGSIINEKDVELIWETATELNNYGFEIERAEASVSPVKNWSKIGFIEGAGNSNSPKEYSFTNKSVSDGTYFYRLKQIDIDGNFVYSDVIEVNVKAPTQYSLKQNYPNPFNPTTAIAFTLAERGFVNLTIYNTLGERVAVLINQQMEAGNYEQEFNAKVLPSGTYIYKITVDEKFAAEKKMLLLK